VVAVVVVGAFTSVVLPPAPDGTPRESSVDSGLDDVVRTVVVVGGGRYPSLQHVVSPL